MTPLPTRAALAGLALALALAPPAPAGEHPPLVVHEWGTLTTVHRPDGIPVGGLNRIAPAEVLPAFVHRFEPPGPDDGPRFGKGPAVPPHPDVTMRLETPVLYFYPPPGGPLPPPFDVEVRMRGGILNEFYPRAEAAVALDHERVAGKAAAGRFDGTRLGNYVVGSLAWKGLALGVPPPDGFPATDAPPWLAPRAVASMPVLAPGGEAEQYLFYRGVAHLDALLATRLVRDRLVLASPRLSWVPREDLLLARVWVADLDGSGGATFVDLGPVRVPRLPDLPIVEHVFAPTEAGFLDTPSRRTPEGAAALRASMHRELVAQGLFPDEAEAMLATWDHAYFRTPGRRVFYTVPREWTDRFLPLAISVPHRATRVLIGRIDLGPG